MSYSKAPIFKLVYGRILLENTKARPLMEIAVINNGIMSRCNEIPAALAAVISKCSARLPKVMIEDTKIASGNASGTRLAEV